MRIGVEIRTCTVITYLPASSRAYTSWFTTDRIWSRALIQVSIHRKREDMSIVLTTLPHVPQLLLSLESSQAPSARHGKSNAKFYNSVKISRILKTRSKPNSLKNAIKSNQHLFSILNKFNPLTGLELYTFRLQGKSSTIFLCIVGLRHQQYLHFSINAAYYLRWHADNSRHSFPRTTFLLLKRFWAFYMGFNEGSKTLYVYRYFSSLVSRFLEFAAGRGSVGLWHVTGHVPPDHWTRAPSFLEYTPFHTNR